MYRRTHIASRPGDPLRQCDLRRRFFGVAGGVAPMGDDCVGGTRITADFDSN